MNSVDILIAVILIASLVIGLKRGFVREVFSLSWIVALWVAYIYTPVSETHLIPYIETSSWRKFATFAIVFLVVYLGCWIISLLVKRLIPLNAVGGVDQLLGMLFGIVRGGVVVAILILVAIFTNQTVEPWWDESLLEPYFRPIAELLRNLLPPEQAAYFDRNGTI